MNLNSTAAVRPICVAPPVRFACLVSIAASLIVLGAGACGGGGPGATAQKGTGGHGGVATGSGGAISGGTTGGGGAPGTGGAGERPGGGESGATAGAAGTMGAGGIVGPIGATVTIDTGHRFQTMEGFGGALAFYVNYLTAHPNRAEIYDIIFRDLGLDILRVGNWFQPLTVDEPTVAAVAAATTSLGHAPRLLMSSWSPPASLKSNGDIKNGGTLIQKNGAYVYDPFGQWWADALVAYAARGVRPDFISMQNEPDFKESWETCLFGPTEGVDSANGGVSVAGYDKALDAVFAHVQAAALNPIPQLLGPEVSGLAGNKLQNYLARMNTAHFFGVAHHLYSGGTPATPDTFNTALQAGATVAADKPHFMTEFSPTTRDMFTTAWLINNAVTVEGVSGYIYWDLTWDAPNGLVTTENPFDQSKWTTTKGYAIRDSYYAVKHFARWVDTGWTRVAAASSVSAVKTSAFLSPDGLHTTIVLLNTGMTSLNVAVATGAWAFTGSDIFRTVGTTTERTREIGPLTADGALVLAAQGIATVTLTQ